MSKVNLGVTVDKEVAENLDKYCKDRIINKSGFINKMLKDFLRDEEVLGNY